MAEFEKQSMAMTESHGVNPANGKILLPSELVCKK